MPAKRRVKTGQLVAFLAIALAAVPCLGAAGTPLDSVDLGEGVFASEPEFDFKDRTTAVTELFAVLEGPPDMSRHLRAIRAFARRGEADGEAVPNLREAMVKLKSSKRERAEIEIAFVMGWLAKTDDKEARFQYLKDMAPLVASIRQNQASDPWGRLVAAMLYATFPELQGNWFDEALYALCYGYDETAVQLAAGSFLLGMDLSFGGNERIQWFVFLAFSRARELAPANEALRSRLKGLVNANTATPGYRSSRWLRALA